LCRDCIPFSVTRAVSLAPSDHANSSDGKNFLTRFPWAKKSQHHGLSLFQPTRRTRNLTGFKLRPIATIAKTLAFIANIGKRKAATSKDTRAA
jgi:hypothetical protein